MNTSSNPLIRPGNPFQRRLVSAVEGARPARGGAFGQRRLPGGTALEWRQKRQVFSVSTPFKITNAGKVMPGLVGTKMPTLGGVALDNVAVGALDLTDHGGNFKVYFKMTFSVTYLTSFLSAYSLTSVTIETATSTPADTDSVKYLQFNTITARKPAASFFSASINVALYDNGANATLLSYARA
ncbi:hypothetical protein [Prosthecobacter sp.]|uniref:hypothetical protein n=1 Tax=Prosthecobacter sp. TaxID=1965333 RepID=UPI003783BA6A